MHTAAAWSDHSPVFGEIDLVLENAQRVEVPNPYEWADAVLGVAESWTSKGLYAVADTLVTSLPYDSLRHQLEAHSGSAVSAEDLRFTRKFLLIARDAIILTVPDVANSQYDPLFEVTRQLGKLADRNNFNALQLTAAIKTLETTPFTPPKLISDNLLKALLSKNLRSSLPVLCEKQNGDAETYHQHRKEFRRVVHAAMAHVAIDPTDTNTLLAQEGIVINRQFGAVKDNLLGTPNLSGHLSAYPV